MKIGVISPYLPYNQEIKIFIPYLVAAGRSQNSRKGDTKAHLNQTETEYPGTNLHMIFAAAARPPPE